MANHQIRISNASGVLQYVITDFLWLSYVKGANRAGLARFGLSGDHEAIQNFDDLWQVKIQRRDQDNGIPWTTEFSGLWREPAQEGTDPGIYEALAPGDLSLLDRRVVAWPADTSNRSAFVSVKAETIMKTLVDYNAGSNATTGNGRIRTGTISGISIQTDGANGNTLNWYCAGKPLLKELQALALAGGGDFDLVKTGAAAWEFRWYTGQLGTDRSSTVLFALDRGNMGNPRFRRRRLEERTVAIVAGQGKGSSRDFVVRTGANYAADNDIELWVDARNVSLGDTTALNNKGDQVLADYEEVEEFLFDVLQTPASLYGLHYFLGDKVGAVSPFSGSTVTRKVESVTIQAGTAGDEIISIGLGNE